MSLSPDTHDYDRFDELAEEFAERYRKGERPSLQEYVDRFPEMAEEIREMFPALVEVEQADGDARDEAAPHPTSLAPHLSQIGDYRILREVGRGGMGVVYEAEQISLGRRVALKVLPGHVIGDRKTQERFRREAKAAARLHHTNIVPVFEVGRDREVSFYAMQLIQGQGLDQVIDELRRLRDPGRKSNAPASPREPATVSQVPLAASEHLRKRELSRMAESLLSGRLVDQEADSSTTDDPTPSLVVTERFGEGSPSSREQGPPGGDRVPAPSSSSVMSSSAVMPGGKHVSEVDTSGRRQPFLRSVAQIGRQAAQGLAHPHARGIIHRDIKPSNLLLDTDGVVWITDFGLAKADDDGMTATGDILGTLRYMAPERFRGGGDARADIFALGLTLYELLTLKPAYDSVNRLNLIEQIKNDEPLRPRSIDRQISRDLETIVLKAIAKEPERRYPTADAMAEDLRRFLADEPIMARQISTSERYWRWARRNPVIVGLGAMLAAVLVLATIGSLVAAVRFANLADQAKNSAVQARNSAAAEHGARIDAEKAQVTADQARKAAETTRTTAQSETYRAMISEVKALRAGRQLGWRDEALANLARLAVMPTPRRDLAELRTEAVASLGEFGVKEVARLAVPGWAASPAEFSPDSRTLVTVSGDGNLDLWDVPGRSHLRRLYGVTAQTASSTHVRRGLVQFLPNGELAYLSSKGGVAFLDASGAPSARAPILRGTAKALKLCADVKGTWFAVGWDDGHIDFHDALTDARKRSFLAINWWDFAFSPDGDWFALHTSAGLEIARTNERDSSFKLPQGGGHVPAIAFSPDGAKIASADERAVLVWDLTKKKAMLRLTGHKETVTAIAFSPDGSMIATSCGDATTRIWDARDGHPLTSLPGPSYLESLAFSPSGSTPTPTSTTSSSGWLTRKPRTCSSSKTSPPPSLQPKPPVDSRRSRRSKLKTRQRGLAFRPRIWIILSFPLPRNRSDPGSSRRGRTQETEVQVSQGESAIARLPGCPRLEHLPAV
jgi:eukaryotic-like serine/threonine-protein kinase